MGGQNRSSPAPTAAVWSPILRSLLKTSPRHCKRHRIGTWTTSSNKGEVEVTFSVLSFCKRRQQHSNFGEYYCSLLLRYDPGGSRRPRPPQP